MCLRSRRNIGRSLCRPECTVKVNVYHLSPLTLQVSLGGNMVSDIRISDDSVQATKFLGGSLDNPHYGDTVTNMVMVALYRSSRITR